MPRKIILAAVLCILAIPGVAGAAVDGSSKIPALNPFCWHKKDCVEVRGKYVLGDPSVETLAKDGFVTGPTAAPCVGGEGDEEWGRCLPAGVSKTEISFGGENKFANIGVFIVSMYKYLVGIASIVAVIMIILAGIQWVTSGGNSETISGAKHRISGAVIGLFIAYMSYFILNTINPALVNFRLPQVWLIRPQQLIPKFCKQLEGAENGKLKFRFYSREDDQTSAVDIKKAGTETMPYGQKDANNLDIFSCGRRFLPEDSGAQTCFADICSSERGNRSGCVEGEDKKLACYPGELFVNLSINTESFSTGQDLQDYVADSNASAIGKLAGVFVKKALKTDWKFDTEVFRGVCKVGDTVYLANKGNSKNWDSDSGRKSVVRKVKPDAYYEYTIGYRGLADPEGTGWSCEKGGQLVGYLLRIETDADQSAWEKYGPSFEKVIPIYGQAKWLSSAFSSGPQPNLSVGYNRNTKQAVFGTFSDDVKTINNYIPIEELKKGALVLDVNLTLSQIIRMKGKTSQNPDDFPENIDPGVPAQ